jgi:lipopolysaccharide transport system ATP-binding protein
VSTAWIPGNLLSEGSLIVGAGIITEDPFTVHCDDEYAVTFQVVDSLDGNSARGDFAGAIPGVVRPLLKWSTRYYSDGSHGDGEDPDDVNGDCVLDRMPAGSK